MLVNCSVCLEDINLSTDKEVSILNCGHFFHANCLNDRLIMMAFPYRRMYCPECHTIVSRDNFVKNIFPNVTKETDSILESKENKCEELEKEISLLRSKILSMKESKLFV